MRNRKEERIRIWQGVERQRNRYLRQVTKMSVKALNEQIKPLQERIKSLSRPGEITDALIENLIQPDIIRQLLLDIMLQVGTQFARNTFDGLLGRKAKAGEWQTGIWEGNARAFIDNELVLQTGEIMYVAMTETTKKQVKAIISDAVEQGMSIEKTSAHLASKVRDVNAVRGTRIARTEVLRASNVSAKIGANMTGLELQKEWITSLDERTRGLDDEFNHVRADGEIVPNDKPFILTGEPMDLPHDSAGSPGNTINCRCTVAFIKAD